MEIRRGRSAGSIRTEGGLLPSDLLEKIRAADPDVPGLKDTDFGLPAGDRAREATTRSWNRLVGSWAALEAVRVGAEASDPLVGPTRDRFLLPLFEELGFGRLSVARAVEIEGTSYPISHSWDGRVPVHLVGYGVELDSRTKGVRGAAGAAPHALVQEYLNRADDALWGVVSNGRTLRLLRDSTSLTRQAYVEFDLEAIFEGELYADFALLWSVLHRSRFEGDNPADCLLERWTKKAADDGTRALDKLRGGVEKAIETLGAGFLATKGNAALVDALRSGELDSQDYYRELLRLVYRLIFLFTAEDRRDEDTGRELLLDPAAPEEAAERYRRFYSTVRLRSFAGRRRGSRHPDLWVSLRRVVAALGSDGAPSLALPALGSFLFGPGACRHLDASELTNEALLDAVRALATVEEDRRLRLVDYRNLGAEELGGIYEGLLELHPRIELDANPPRFALGTAAGNERKSTGSYYTPTSLISCLLDSALDPVVDEAVRGKSGPDAEAAILGLSVVDPAAGSGHFLIAAAHRLAKRLAAVRSGEGEPPPAQVRHALRDVIARCIYAVDINPMAVELCKVSLWLEALEPGKPLSFLDAHVKCGNSLLGTTPGLVAGGIPDAAYMPIADDDRAVARAWREANRRERAGQQSMFEAALHLPVDALAADARAIDALPDDTPDALGVKARSHALAERSADRRRSKAALDAWCAAFVAPKVAGAPEITTATVRALGTDPGRAPRPVLDLVAATAAEYSFFHWPLEFPAVFERGGFDVVLGNPPWERVKLQEKEFFAGRSPAMAGARNAAERKRMIAELETADPPLWREFQGALRRSDGESHLLRNSERYPLAGRGDINLYAVFAEGMRQAVGPTGRFGAVLPTGIVTDDTTKLYFRDVVATRSLVSLFDFENKGIFPEVHSSYKFCLFTAGSGVRPIADSAEFVFFAHGTDDLADPDRRLTLSPEDIELLNPNTRTCPIFRSRADAELTKAIYRRVPVLVREPRDGQPEENPWGVRLSSMFHMSNDSHLFRTRAQLEAAGWALEGNVFRRGGEAYLPLYEAKMIWQFDHRYGDFLDRSDDSGNTQLPPVSDADHEDPSFVPVGRHWIPASEVDARLSGRSSRNWFLGFRDITNASNERTVIAAVIPRVAVANNLPLILTETGPIETGGLLANLNSLACDFFARQKVAGMHLNFYLLEQLPVLAPSAYLEPCPWAPHLTLGEWIRPCVVELTFTSTDLGSFARDMGWSGSPFRWTGARREILRAELDAALFRLYLPATPDGDWRPARVAEGAIRDETDEELAALRFHFPTPRHAVEHILDSFPIVRRKDEDAHGEYRTKRVILEIYDAMQEATRTSVPYQTSLDPPPGDPRAAHPPDPGEPPGRWVPWDDVLARSAGAVRGSLPQPASTREAAPRHSAPLSEIRSSRSSSASLPLGLGIASAPDGGTWLPETSVEPTSLVIGSRVRHRTFGTGTVLSIEMRGRAAQLLVRFDEAGEKWIAFGYGLLEFLM